MYYNAASLWEEVSYHVAKESISVEQENNISDKEVRRKTTIPIKNKSYGSDLHQTRNVG